MTVPPVGIVLVAATLGLAATMPAEGATATRLAVKGDWGAGTSAQARVTRRMCVEHRRRPFRAILTTGDNFSEPAGEATRDNFWRPERCLRAARIPWVAAWGNHDLRADATARVLGAQERWRALTIGPARVVVLDANIPDDPVQLDFLRREMDRRHRGPRIAVFHQPAHTAGPHAPGRAQQLLWEPHLRRGGVDLVLQGHNHTYERLEVGGLTHITTGGGGAQMFPCIRPTRALRVCRMVHHFVSLSITPRAIAVRAVSAAGHTIDRVRIRVR